MKNNKQKKHMISGKTKEEKRRLAFEKRNVKKEQNVARYGAEGGTVLVMAKTADFNRRFVAAFLALVFAISCLVVGVNFATKAEMADGFNMLESSDDNGLVMRKGLKDNGDGTYDLRMEAYATGSTATQVLDTNVPLDIVMVLDQSGSMLENDSITGSDYIEAGDKAWTAEEAAGYYYDDGDGCYKLSADENYTYTPYTNPYLSDSLMGVTGESLHTSWNSWQTPYHVQDSNDGMVPLYVRTKGYLGGFEAQFFYDDNGTTKYLKFSNGTTSATYSRGGIGTGSMNSNSTRLNATVYKQSSSKSKTHLYYTKDGTKTYLGDDAIISGQTAYTGKLYSCEYTYQTRLETLKNAANAFVKSVSEQAEAAGVDHRVAVVGFAGNQISGYSSDFNHIIENNGVDTNRFNYTNTGLFVNGDFKNYQTLNETALASADLGGDYTKLYVNENYYVKFTTGSGSYTSGSDIYYQNGDFVPIRLFYDSSYDQYIPYALYVSSDGKTMGWYTLYASNGRWYFTVNNTDYYCEYGHYYGSQSTDSNTFHSIYDSLTVTDYKNALESVRESDASGNGVNDDIDTALDKVDGYGGTSISYGMTMANNIFKNNSADGRKRIVVVFTDGQPGSGANGFENAVAEEALYEATRSKNEYGASVYTIGLFEDDPGTQVETFMHQMSSEYYSSTKNVYDLDPSKAYLYQTSSGETMAVTAEEEDQTGILRPSLAGWTDNYVSYYPADGYTFYSSNSTSTATAANRLVVGNTYYIGTRNNRTKVIYKYVWFNSNGYIVEPMTSATDSASDHYQFMELQDADAKETGTYYFKAGDAEGLNDAFGTIAEEIQSPYTTVLLDHTNATLKDIITENFNVPPNPTITAQTAPGTYSDGAINWDPADNDATLTPSWDSSSKTISVTGFDYNSNYVAEGHSGKKIIVTISGLTLSDKVKSEGDRRLYSNTSASGIYKTGEEETLYAAFPRPFIDDTSMMVPAGSSGKIDATSGIVVNKYLTAKENGKYDLTVETYTTKTSTEVKEKVPTDFIVVADQSGSMSEKDMATAYTSASDAYLETIATSSNGYYYYDSDTGNYYRVYPVKGYLYQYYAANTKWAQDVIEEGGMDLSWFQGTEDASYSVANQYYYKLSDGVYRPVGVSAKGKVGTYYVKLHYTDANGDTVYFVRPTYPVYKNVFGSGKYQYGDLGYRAINAAVTGAYSDPEAYTYSEFLGITTGMYINYPMYKRRVGYTELRYRDVNGVEHTVSAKNGSTTWEYCNSSKQALTTASGSTRPTYSGLYQASSKITRLEALKNALTNFVTAVANEEDDVNKPVGNRIAIVGFSSDGFNNTELLTGENLSINGTNGTQKTTADANVSAHYGTALVNATSGTTGSVNPKITEAINALTASGGTQPEDGLDMAYKILTNRSQKTYTVQSSAEHETIDRNVFVIFFTDGQPGDYPFSNMYTEANDVVEKAKLIKDYRVGDSNVAADRVIIPSLFSIGVFGESDGNPLTYAAHKENSLKTTYEYEPGWMETFDANNYSNSATGGYRYQYLNRNWLPIDEENYGTTPNDTIYDYMSVVSSNYPSATKFMNVKSKDDGEADTTGYANYLGMVGGVRGDSIGSNRYYRMASNQDTLVGAFEQAVTMTNQTISYNQRLDSSSVMRDIFDDTNFKTSTDTMAKTYTVNGSMDKNGIVNFDESTRTSINLPATIGTVNGKTTVDVTGFDYLENYINYGTGTGASYIPQNNGKKLVLTITNIEPKAGVVSTDAAPLVYSNDVASAMYVNNTNKVNNTEFPTPAITRHRYTLDVGEVNTTATFDVAVKVLDSNKEVVAKDADMLEDVMLVYPDGTRAKYSEVGGQTFLSMKNGESFYFENLPDTYQVQTEVTATDDAYNYKIYYDSEAPTNAVSIGEAQPHPFAYKDSTIHIISTRGSKAVTIREETTGSYGDLTRVFDEIITMDMPVISETTNKEEFSFNCTFNDDYSSFDDDLPKNADSYTAVFGNVTQNDGTITTKLIRIDSVKGNNAYSKTITDGKLPMKHGDVMTLTNVPSGNTVKVQEDDSFDHDLFYYYGQDNISPSYIRLKTTTGSLMEGTHTFTLRPVDGTDGSDLTLTFVDGVVTNPSAEIDLGLYQRASVVNDDMSEAVLDIAGTTFTFDTETSDADIAYVATIKQLAYDPPVQVTVDKTDMDILVVNRIGDIAVTGIFDDSQHNWVIYVLAGIAILSAGAGAAYVYRRKRLTTER